MIGAYILVYHILINHLPTVCRYH